MLTAIIPKIISMQPSLTASENEIGRYVIHHAEEVSSSTITSVAKSTGTSEASINRFCKKLGFKGFQSFKIALIQENFYKTMKQEKTDVPSSFIISVCQDYQHILVNTSAMLSESTLMAAADAIRQARHIDIFSFSNTAFVAEELEFKLNMVGLPAKAVTDINSMRVFSANIREGDLVAVIVPSILMRDIYQAVTVCKDHGAKILSITSYDSPKLNDLVDFKFITSDKITTRNPVALSNNLAFLYVVDVLYCALLKNDKSLRQKKLNSDTILNNQQMLDSYMLEY